MCGGVCKLIQDCCIRQVDCSGEYTHNVKRFFFFSFLTVFILEKTEDFY